MAEKRISSRLKRETERRVVISLSLLGLLYAFFFLPESVLSYFQGALTSVWNTLLSLGLAGAVGGVLGYVVSAQDLLATGKGRAPAFFRNEYPSTAIVNHYQCTRSEANALWFDVFNPWENIAAMKDSYTRTFERGAACRFIFVLQWSLVIFLLLCSITWAATLVWQQFSEPIDPNKPLVVFARIVVLIAVVLISGSLFALNRPSGPTGCWFRWREINDLHRAWLTNEVFAKAPDYRAARVLITDAGWRQSHGYA